MRSRAEVYFLTAWQPSFQDDDDDEGGDLYSMLVRTTCVCLSGKMIIFATKKKSVCHEKCLPDICQHWYTSALFMPVRSTPKNVKIHDEDFGQSGL